LVLGLSKQGSSTAMTSAFSFFTAHEEVHSVRYTESGFQCRQHYPDYVFDLLRASLHLFRYVVQRKLSGRDYVMYIHTSTCIAHKLKQISFFI